MLNPAITTRADRLCRPQRLGTFGHRGVGKTTLLTMLYREAVAGRLEGCRLAAADPATAEYLADKIVQLETGQPLPATLAETELRLNLYHGSTRIELVMKDYQGEHLELGREEPIHAFLRDCDAVWLCFDSSVARPEPRDPSLLRRQQEVEQLIESYLAAEPHLKMKRPFALVLTKADLLHGTVTEMDERLAMTRHALETHCPNSDLFAVSCLEPAARELGSKQSGFCLQATGLSEPLTWLVGALQAQDEARLDELFALAPDHVKLLGRCLDSFARRYPDALTLGRYREQLRLLRRQRLRRQGLVAGAAAACLVLGLWTYDALGYHKVRRFETVNADDPATVLKEWESYQGWHPTRHLLSPEAERAEKDRLKELEKESRQQMCARRLDELRRLGESSQCDAEALWTQLLAFRDEYPDVSKADWEPLHNLVMERRDELRARKAGRAFEELVGAEQRGGDLTALLVRADSFLGDHASSAHESEVRRRRASYVLRIDECDIDVARNYSSRYPFNFQTRREHYQRYLDKHASGGAFLREAETALRNIDSDWDKHDFRGVRDHFEQNPGDIANLVARSRSYLAAHPGGRFVAAAHDLLRFSELVTTTGEYRVTLRCGQVEKKTARLFSRGPDLSVELEVNGIRYGPSTITVNKYEPEWNFEYPRPIRWKLGDSVRIRVIDHDWKDRVVIDVASDDTDPLALRLLSGDVWSGNNSLTFESDFAIPVLPKIE